MPKDPTKSADIGNPLIRREPELFLPKLPVEKRGKNSRTGKPRHSHRQMARYHEKLLRCGKLVRPE